MADSIVTVVPCNISSSAAYITSYHIAFVPCGELDIASSTSLPAACSETIAHDCELLILSRMTTATSSSPWKHAHYSSLAFCYLLLSVAAAAAASTSLKSKMAQAREDAKPWYNRNTPLPFGRDIPISPVTIIVLLLGGWYMYGVLFPPSSWCEASHILCEKESTLKDLDIKNDAAKFATVAKSLSTCPSKAAGGYLGRFKPGDMAPPFDKACFSPTSPIQTTMGPIQTTFGWHLIFIHKRHLQR